MAKICHITSLHNQEDVRIFRKECMYLSNFHEVCLIAPGENSNKGKIHIYGTGQREQSLLSRIFITHYHIMKIIKKLDAEVYHLHDPDLLLLVHKLARSNKKIIFDVHEDTEVQILEKKKVPLVFRRLLSKLYGIFQAQVFKRIDGLVVTSPHIHERLHKLHSNIVTITNYPINDSCGSHRSTASIIPAICYVGNSSPQWNHEKVIKSLQGMAGVTYHLYGDFSTSNSISKKYLGSQHLKFEGRIPHDEVLKEISQYSAGIALLSKGYNTGFNRGTLGNTKIFEYMQAGIPIIATDFDEWKSIINKYDCGICVNIDDLEQIRDAITNLVHDSKRSLEMGKNGQIAVAKEFNWESQFEKLLNFYNNI